MSVKYDSRYDTETTARTPVRRLATYYAADLREGDRVVYQGHTYTLASMRTVTTYRRDPASTRIGLGLDDPEPTPTSAQAAWGVTPRQARILTVWVRPDETLDVEEDHQ